MVEDISNGKKKKMTHKEYTDWANKTFKANTVNNRYKTKKLKTHPQHVEYSGNAHGRD